ncbi:MAG TPA: HNH endonuclease signature motif containing protein [Gemmatimonadaceae bacterium]|nr:HNH endonuclease signature motif containing protein [Gemmatimonadaceae bacterium]
MSRHLQDSPYRDEGPKQRSFQSSPSHHHLRSTLAQQDAIPDGEHPARSHRGRRRRGKQGAKRGASHRPLQLTSHPTGRVAYAETRRWLLEQHGPVCAYCGDRFAPTTMTLDHVAPRRGQTAYDRRDNLVLACKTCNAAKRDLAPIAFLLARRSRATHLLRYGTHLSPMLIELASSLAPEESPYRD